MRGIYDAFAVGVNLENSYELMDAGSNMHDVAFCGNVWDSYSLRYSYFMRNCSNCFGCIGLRNKSYCILNKQYSKEEYEELLPKIKKHMNEMPYRDSMGREYLYGEFFPPELSPFAYNESVVQEYFPLGEADAKGTGYSWRQAEGKDCKITLQAKDMPDTFVVEESITDEVVGCAHFGRCNEQCTNGFRITPQEFQFYKKTGFSLPALCPNCRHYERLRKRNPMKLWSRKCQCAGQKSENGIYQNTIAHPHGTDHCSNELQTSYSPDRPEIVYCENCYQVEIV